jgi:hypothetical protein
MAVFTMARITAFNPGQSPPAVNTPILLILALELILPPELSVQWLKAYP